VVAPERLDGLPATGEQQYLSVGATAAARRLPGVPLATGSSRRYAALDALRGVAALAVVAYHIGVGLKLPWLAPRGYLAVDFFFVLSGFVLARAYGERLVGGRMSALEFLRRRYLRLWPVACVGTALGIVLSWPAAVQAPSVAAAGLLLLPNLWRADLTAYPYNPPHWSLWHEVVANYGYGVVAPRLTAALLGAWIAGSAFVLGYHVLAAGNGDDLWLARVAYSFAMGVAIERARPARSNVGILTLSALLILALSLGRPSRVDLALTLLLFPALVWLGASTTVGRRLGPICSAVGRASYPLYAWHMPILLRVINP